MTDPLVEVVSHSVEAHRYGKLGSFEVVEVRKGIDPLAVVEKSS